MNCTHRCDERFIGYGGNKAACLFELYLSGVSFYVLPDDFLIHQSHAYAEKARKHERKYNRKLYTDFREELCFRYLNAFLDQIESPRAKVGVNAFRDRDRPCADLHLGAEPRDRVQEDQGLLHDRRSLHYGSRWYSRPADSSPMIPIVYRHSWRLVAPPPMFRPVLTKPDSWFCPPPLILVYTLGPPTDLHLYLFSMHSGGMSGWRGAGLAHGTAPTMPETGMRYISMLLFQASSYDFPLASADQLHELPALFTLASEKYRRTARVNREKASNGVD